ncbi:hypothetical protein CAI21_22055 [Alkalilimnicola ehrlichii]|nr:hypothetical protein CAI21_22055 [Alkalilimnicola ehrlichii]
MVALRHYVPRHAALVVYLGKLCGFVNKNNEKEYTMDHGRLVKPLFNGWVIAGLSMNTLSVLLMLLVAADEFALDRGFAIFLLGIAGVGCLSLLGGAMLGFGQARLGAWLLIIGSVVFVPVGIVGLVGGLSILDQLKVTGNGAVEAVSAAGADSGQVEPEKQYFSKSTTLFLVLGVGNLIIGMVMMSLLGIGTVHLVIGGVALVAAYLHRTNALVSFYEGHVTFRKAVILPANRHVRYDSLKEVDGDENTLVIRYEQGGREEVVKYDKSMLDKLALNDIKLQLRRAMSR